MWVVYSVAAAGFLCAIIAWHRHSRRDANELPEGPRCYPLLGMRLLTHPERTLHRWAQDYGSLYSFTIGNQRFVVVSDPEIAKFFLSSRGSICSDRKKMFVENHTIFKGRDIMSNPYGDTWRRNRKLATISLGRQDINQQIGVLDSQTTKMIRTLYTDGANEERLHPQIAIKRCSLSCISAITFGSSEISVAHSQVLALSREFMNITGPMSNLVDFVPVWLQNYLPWKKKLRGKKLHASLMDTYGREVKRVEYDMENDVYVGECLVKTMITRKNKDQLDDLDMIMMASEFMLHGLEATTLIIEWFSALISSHADVQRKAHQELDRIVGRSRLPNLEDEANLPYCRAIVKEVERCHNPFWQGIPHATSKDLVYNDKLIPARSVLVLNTWSMHHDPDRWLDPYKFNPDRYLDDHLSSAESARRNNPRLRDHWTFGAGRRICPGMHVAQRQIWLAVTKMLWAFELQEVPDQSVDLEEYDDGSGRSPLPFKIKLRPRFKEVDKVITEADTSWN
ncbi:uncharacterized protein SETTUDRAFT_110763 [Exserohilum turcica Et28A]|uniref:Cytochrome P450 n=1 Tax=Exserohilum turcicum (strain 28A) TaxID=671987 RepID=R0JY89_EXST2|nr:uncharacterized protein SETTUDRAFT_110763 [Exserohilum turcica Et28A]EOA85883.1 hypothetical protein SETTUDRAFT_110763 [Exserohilum turcica Et28A]